MFTKLCHDTIRIRCWLIHLVYRNNDWNFCCFCMVNRFNCLRHDTIICSNDKYCNICDKCTACTHRRKCRVSWCI